MDIDLDKYGSFVKSMTSEESENCQAFLKRIENLDHSYKDFNAALAMTSCLGLSSEAGEFTEIIKKIVFQGKPFADDVRFHIQRELGDILWYWANACRAFGFEPSDVLKENIRKLSLRYPDGEFNSYFSEHRQQDDV
jgi:NTP pyrophosphatase (non-canonical NTP hydrolase)